MREPEVFSGFVVARSPALLRTARLITGDNAVLAQDLVQASLAKVWRRWARIEAPETYVRTTMVRTYLNLAEAPLARRDADGAAA